MARICPGGTQTQEMQTPGPERGEPEEGPAGRGAHKVREAGTAGGSPDYRLPGEKRALGVKGP